MLQKNKKLGFARATTFSVLALCLVGFATMAGMSTANAARAKCEHSSALSHDKCEVEGDGGGCASGSVHWGQASVEGCAAFIT